MVTFNGGGTLSLGPVCLAYLFNIFTACLSIIKTMHRAAHNKNKSHNFIKRHNKSEQKF